MADDTAAVVVDCYGGWRSAGTGKVEDLFLARLRRLGFTDVTQFIPLEEPGKVVTNFLRLGSRLSLMEIS